MARSSVSDVLGLLQAATLEPAKLPEAISALQALVWKSNEWGSGLPAETVDALADLAYDLDFYEPNPPLTRGWLTIGCSGSGLAVLAPTAEPHRYAN